MSIIYDLPNDIWKSSILSLPFDLLLFFAFSGLLIIPFLIFQIIKPRIAEIFYHTLAIIFILIDILLLNSIANNIIKPNFCINSIDSIKEIIFNPKLINPTTIFSIGFALPIYFIIVFSFRKIKLNTCLSCLFILIALIAAIFIFTIIPNFKNIELSYNVLSNYITNFTN